VDILSKKDQIDTKNDNKDIKVLKDELCTRRVNMEAKIAIFRRNQLVEETTLLKEIQRNNTRKQEVQKELEKENGQAWEDNGVVYIEEIYVSNNQKIQEQIL